VLREYESWAWAVGIALIWVDLVLPVPQTAVIAALGIIYGTLLGGLLGSIALVTGGLLGYGLMLTSARRLVHRFVGPESLHRMESFFDRGGAWAIVLTRSLPYSVPEALVFLAGLAGMPMKKFAGALTIGSVPTAFAFAAIGAGWADQPIVALGVSFVLSVLLLAFAGLMLLAVSWRRGQANTHARQDGGDRAPVVANLAAFGLFLLSFLISFGSPAGSTALLLALSGSLLALMGAALVVSSRAELGPAWSFVPKADQSTGLITTGPYGLVRHPIYLGLALLAIGEALAFDSWLALFIALSGIVPTFVWRARAEEKLLSRTFGDRYEIYRQRTKMTIPHLL
jgi:protein-S-isoprenylcysteine O-methyltransferase Ste14